MGQTYGDKLAKLWEDMYEGRGKGNPPMTVRVDRLEQCVETILENGKSTRNTVRGGVATIIVGLILAYISFKLGWVHP